MDWFKNRFAESYGGGSSSGDFLGTQDGSETNENERDISSPSNGNGQGNVPAYGDLNHPFTPDGEQSHNSDMTNQGLSEHAPGDTDKFVTEPFGEQMVDDNHANVSASLLSIFTRKAKLGEEADFFTSSTTGVADSPQIMDRNDGGHAEEELQTADNGVESTNNNYTGTEGHTFGDPTVVDQEETSFQNSHPSTPDINKGRTAHLKWRPSFITRGVRTAGYSWGDNSNVEDTMHPDEESNIISNKDEDHGNKDQSSTDNQQNAPLQDDVTPDSKYFSGIDNTAGLLSIIMKTADAGGLMPSVNPNSGRDEQDDEKHKGMGDGKESYISDNVADKDFLDPAIYRQKHVYYGPGDRAGDDEEDYFKNFNSGGGSGTMGLEGDTQNSSGVDNT